MGYIITPSQFPQPVIESAEPLKLPPSLGIVDCIMMKSACVNLFPRLTIVWARKQEVGIKSHGKEC